MSEAGLEQKYIKEAFDSNWVVPLGPNVDGFEKELEAFVNESQNEKISKRVVALNSGTAAVHLSLLDCGVGLGDEVMTQSFTFCASAHPVSYLGATPVFVDSEPYSWNIDISLLEQAIEDRIRVTGKKPKAIVPVTLYGMPYDIDALMSVAERFDIPVIEDTAEGLGSRWKGRALGTFGRYGILSFNGNKMITTSGGGALICPDDESWRRIMFYATQARESYPYYHHESIGFNYRMSNICAGIGRGQMSVLETHLNHHKHIQHLYEEAFANFDGIKVHKAPDSRYESNFWLCTILLDERLRVKGQEHAYENAVQGSVGGAAGVMHLSDRLHTDCEPNANVEGMRLFLKMKGIEARPLWKPMHKQPVYHNAPAYTNGVSEGLFRRGLCLPSGPCVSDKDVHYIIDSIKESVGN